MRKRVKKGKKFIDSQIVVSRQFDFTRKSKGKFRFTKNTLIYRRIGRNRQINGRIAINGPDKGPVDESSRLSRERPIGDGGLRCAHVA